MEKRKALEILRELTTAHTIEPGEICPQLKYKVETYQEAVEVFAGTIVETEECSKYIESLKSEIKNYKNGEAAKERTVYEELFDRIFRSGEPFSIQVGGLK